jgi:hypothetical protein
METEEIELHYQPFGGHGGPYSGLSTAFTAACNLIRGCRSVHSIELRNRRFPYNVIKTVTRKEAVEAEYMI